MMEKFPWNLWKSWKMCFPSIYLHCSGILFSTKFMENMELCFPQNLWIFHCIGGKFIFHKFFRIQVFTEFMEIMENPSIFGILFFVEFFHSFVDVLMDSTLSTNYMEFRFPQNLWKSCFQSIVESCFPQNLWNFSTLY